MTNLQDQLLIDDMFVGSVIAGSRVADVMREDVRRLLGVIADAIVKGCARRVQSNPFVRKYQCQVPSELRQLSNLTTEYSWKIECVRKPRSFGARGADELRVDIFFCESTLHEHDHFDDNDGIVFHFGQGDAPLHKLRLVHGQLKVLLAGVVGEFGGDTNFVETLKSLVSLAPKK